MAKIVVYTTQVCPYCVRAKALLRAKNLPFEEIDVARDAKLREEAIRLSGGRRTVPQIFIDGRSIGGYDELYEMEQSGELDRLVGAAGETA
ncbi:MAG TPA: glutaredoxin 3 [Candidatus Binatia bacterium]|jgi:glutaredoxin 3